MGAIIPAVKVNLAASGSVVLESPIIIEDKEVSRMTPQEYAQGLRGCFQRLPMKAPNGAT